MIEQRERMLAIMIAGALLLGIGFDLVTGSVKAPARLPVRGDRIVEQTSYCPPPIEAARSTAQVTVASLAEERVPFSFDPQAAGKLMHLESPGSRVMKAEATTAVTAYGSVMPSASTVQVYDPIVGAGAARCSRFASTRWYFPEGSSALGFDEKLILYNPFPDEAVARITFFTETGDLTRARLAEGVAVPAGTTKVLNINEFVQPQPLLSAVVEMSRGRVVAWRASLVDPKEQAAGVQFSLGAPNSATTWYLPAGSVEEGVEEKINILNPSRDEAIVSVSLVTAKETLQPPKLVEVAVPAASSRRLPLSEFVGRGGHNIGGAGVIVRSTNSVRFVAERTIWYDLDAVSGVSSEMGSAVAQPRWLVPPALLKPTTDTLVLLNPGPGRITVDVAILRDRAAPDVPAKFRGIVVGPGTRRRIEISGNAGMLFVRATGPVVAERAATSSRDAAAVMGIPSGS
ncbi:MAG TPA: DUF5719 family protein [Actinomycetota bacterium]|nr:DUF5719 family protein [Actinomycetota bacterium]